MLIIKNAIKLFIGMIHLTKGQTSNIVLTLTEKATLSAPNWLFVFKSRNTIETTAFVLLGSSDLSTFKERYNSFSLVVDTYFGNKTAGEYSYTVHEQQSTTNINPKLSGKVVERGQMTLKNASDYSYTSYNNAPNTYKVRDI